MVFTLGLMGLEFVFPRSRTKKLSPGVNVGFTHTKRSLAAKEMLMLAVTSQSLLKTIYTPLRVIPNWLRNLAITTVRKVSLMLEHSRHCTPAPIVVSVTGRDAVFDSFSLATTRINLSRVESDFTAVELAVLHHELAVDPLRWFADFAVEKHWHSLDAENQQLQGLIHIWYTAGTYDQLNLGGVAAMEELARQIQSHVDPYSDPDNVSRADSRFYAGLRRAGDALVPSLRWHVDRQFKNVKETERVQRLPFVICSQWVRLCCGSCFVLCIRHSGDCLVVVWSLLHWLSTSFRNGQRWFPSSEEGFLDPAQGAS